MEYKNVMLISPDTIKTMGDINSNLDEEIIGASIRAIQNVYLVDVLGTKLVDKLQQLTYNTIKGLEDSLDDDHNNHFKVLLTIYIPNVMGYKVVSDLCLKTALKIRNAGVVNTNDNNVTNVSLKDVKYLMDIYETYYNSALNRMMEYIKENEEQFKEFIKVCKVNKYGNIGLYLG